MKSLLRRVWVNVGGARFVGVLFLWAVMLLLFAFLVPNFYTFRNFTSVLQFSTILALVTIGQTLVILAGGGGIDLSVGGIVSLTGLAMAASVQAGVNVWLAAGIAILAGIALGSVNGFLITRLRIMPLIVTLGTFYAYNGLAIAVTGGAPIGGIPASFGFIGQDEFLGVPLHVYLVLFPAFLVTVYVLTQLPIGRWIYAMGEEERSARLVGIGVWRTRFCLYLASGALAALAGIVANSWLLTARPDIGQNLELESLTAALLGGTSIFGGYGTVIGSMLAVYFLSALRAGLQLSGINAIWQLGIVGVLLIGSVLADRWTRGESSSDG